MKTKVLYFFFNCARKTERSMAKRSANKIPPGLASSECATSKMNARCMKSESSSFQSETEFAERQIWLVRH